MKKLTTLFCLVILCAVFALPAFAASKKSGGYVGGNSSQNTKVSTVAEAQKMRDDTDVVLRGRITKQLGKEKYTFTDDTGSITIEIDDDDWNGVTASAKDTVTIYGEVEKDHGKTEIDVDRIELYKQDSKQPSKQENKQDSKSDIVDAVKKLKK